jgi:iron complex outermembrane receptor protein
LTGLTLYRHQIITITGWVMRVSVLAGVLCFVLVSVGNADPASAAIRKSTNIPAEPLDLALKSLAKERQFQVLFRAEVVRDVRTGGAVGDFTPEEAIRQLLSGTGLSYKYLDVNTVTVFPQTSNPAPSGVAPHDGDETPKEGKKGSSDGFRVAQVDPGQTSSDVSVEKEASKKKPIQLEEVVVTGTRLQLRRNEGPQDVKIFTKEQLDQSGQTTINGFLSTIPEVSVAVTENGFQTGFGITTVQLHGLPFGTTLVLIDGRRVEASGISQGGGDFFDLNNIPLSAVERVEVVSEGSSAIYGSDALAGVVNVILRKNFDGFEANAKYGGASGTDEWNSSLAWGKHWDKGSVSVVGSFQTRSELEGFERGITASQDYTPYGGPDNRVATCNPGNVSSVDGSNLPGVGAPYAAVPTGFNGKPTQAEFAGTAGTQNECSVSAYNSFIPETRRFGLLARATFNITESSELFADALFAHVQQFGRFSPPQLAGFPQFSFTTYSVSASNPYNPFGEQVGITGLLTGLGRQSDPIDTVFVRPEVGASGTLFTHWTWEVVGTFSQDRTNFSQTNTLNSAAVQNALNSSNPATALNPFIAGPPGSPALLQSLAYDQVGKYSGGAAVAEGFIRGPVLQLPSGSIDSVIGGTYERDRLYSDLVNSPFFPPNTEATFYRSSYAAFAEARIPIVGSHGTAGAPDILAVTLAGRYDHYSDFGSKTTPQLGAEWRPAASLLIRGSYSKAFKAPSLYDLHAPAIVVPGIPVHDPLTGQTDLVTALLGGNMDLGPERGQSRTLGLVYASVAVPGLQLSVTHWGIDINNDIQSLNPQALVDNAALFPGSIVRASTCSSGPPCPITQINDLFVNFGTMSVAGLDYQVRYAFSTPLGDLASTLSATQTYRYTTALTPNTASNSRVSEANDDGNFAPRWKGTAALGWKLGPYTASVSGRYVGKYQDYDSTREIGNFWLCDANFRYALGSAIVPNNDQLRKMYVELGGVNVFNRLPQFSNYAFGTVGYDPAEADIRGRFLYVQVGIRF